MSKKPNKKTQGVPNILTNTRLCDSCSNCVTLNSVNQVVKTKHFSEESYGNKSFNESICKITATGLRNVSECDKYKKTDMKSVN